MPFLKLQSIYGNIITRLKARIAQKLMSLLADSISQSVEAKFSAFSHQNVHAISLLKAQSQDNSSMIANLIEQVGLQQKLIDDSIKITNVDCDSRLVENQLASNALRHVQANQNLLSRIHRLEAQQPDRRKLRCAFMVADTTLWDVYSPIYKSMSMSEDFEPIVIAFARQDVVSDKEEIDILSFFTRIGIDPEMQGFDSRPLTSLVEYDLDLIFYTLGSAAYPEMYKIENVSLYARTCYLSYGFLLVDEKEYQFNQPFHHAAWTVFASTDRELKLYEEMSPRLEKNVLLVGYPKFDIYSSVKIKNRDRPMIIWAPHWTIGQVYPQLNFGTFDRLCNDMLKYMESKPEIDFIFKPHPNLRYAIDKLNTDGGDFKGYSEKLNEMPNVSVNIHGDYFEVFMNSSGMITDSVSFLAEYLPTGKPLLFLDRDDRARMSDVGEALISVHYRADNFKEVVDFIDDTVIGDNDFKQAMRSEAITDFLNIDDISSSEKILSYLRSSFQRGPY